MSFSELFIRRPVMTILLMVAIVAFGMGAYRTLPISDLPTIDYPTINVSANLPGASPQTMASSVATPLEKQFSTIAGIDNMTSSSSLGSTSITLQFSLNRNVDAAAQDVQAAIAKTLRQLPLGITPPSYQKTNPAAAPILLYALTSSTMPLSQLDEVGETLIAQRLSTIDGVAQLQVFGAAKYAVRVQLDPLALAYRKLGMDEVATAIDAQNASRPSGVLWGPRTAYTLQANGQLQDAAGFRALTVVYRNGAAISLGSLGLVLDDVENNRSASWYNGTRSIVLAVQRQPGTNTVAVAQRVRAEMASLQGQVPGDVQIHTLFDRSVGIEQSVRDVKLTLLLTLILVVLVIFLFLRNVWATLIPSLALPMSILGTFAVMKLLGYSLDNLSLLALTLAVGFVVDDAIVMLENIVRHLEMGKPPLAAAIEGAREVGFTILSMTLSLTAVFIPLLFLPGIIGRLFREFAVTIAVAILVSGFVSLTLTPMLASRFLRSERDQKHGRFYEVSEHAYERLLDLYKWTLAWSMQRRRAMLVVSALILIGTIALFKLVPTGFIPTEDTGTINISTEAAQGTSFTDMVKRQQAVAAIVGRDSAVDAYMSSVGGAAGATNTGRLQVTLKPRGERPTADEIATRLRQKLARIPGVTAFVNLPPAIQIGGRQSKSQYQFSMQASDITVLYPAAQKLLDAARQSNKLQDVTSDLQLNNPQVVIQINRPRAAAFGLTADQIETTLYNAYGSRQVSTIFTPSNEYSVIMEVLPQYQMDPAALSLLFVRSQSGAMVPLSTVASIAKSSGPSTVNHSGQMPSVTISFNLAPGVSLGAATAEMQRLANETLSGDGIATAFSGTAQVFQSTQAGLMALVVVAIFVIYVVLGVLYESFIHPLTILSGLPFAAFGALLALLLFGTELSVYAFVGIILLIGIVKKNAIMMIDFALEHERHAHTSAEASIIEAAHIRFRPIMMTTVAALVGTLPIALAMGTGAESRRPLGIAVVGGLAFSQFITLYITPIVYTYLDSANRWIEARVESRKDTQSQEQLDLGMRPHVT